MLLIHLEACDKKFNECKFVVELIDAQPRVDSHLSIKDFSWIFNNFDPFLRINMIGAELCHQSYDTNALLY